MEKQNYLEGLNEQQLDAVLCPADIVFVSAGPGTGKTHMLTSKLVHVIDTAATPQKIVALSYTNTAARELGERFQKKLQQSGVSREHTIYNGTIHSFCYRMLKGCYSDFNQIILDDEELSELAEDIHNSTNEPTDLIMDCLKANPKRVSKELYEKICAVKDALEVISIQDILSIFLNALGSDPEFRKWMQERVSVVAVDEAQDLSEINYLILDKMLEVIPGLKVFLVGDPRQNIFEFNGGSYKNLHGFLSRHLGHVTKTLTITYRCGQTIADYVNTFRFSDCENSQLKSISPKEGSIDVETSLTEKEEAVRVIEGIMKKGNLSKSAVICNNLKYLDELIVHLIERGIPYKVFGGRKLLKRHIRFLNHVLRIIDTDNTYSIRKVAQYANIDIVENGRKKRSKFYASMLGRKILAVKENLPTATFPEIAYIVIVEIIRSQQDTDEVTQDYQDFLAIAEEFQSINDYLTAFATDRERFVQFYKSDYVECPIPTDEGFLTLSTIHSAKGLEWNNVFIMGLCEGNFPNPYFCRAKSPQEEDEFFNNEWKKMYVASTRAKESLILTYSRSIKRKGYVFKKDPSRFIQNQIV